MGFGNRGTGEVRVYEYGVPRAAMHRGLASGLDVAVAEMRGRIRLWNRLVEIENAAAAQRAIVLEPLRDANGRLPKRAEMACDDVEALDVIEEQVKEAVNRACRESGLYSANYSEVKVAWSVARRRPGELRYHSVGEAVGKTSVVIPRGITVERAYDGTHTMLRIQRGNRPTDALVSIRVHSDAEHKPVWLTLPVVMHRPLPADGLIKTVSAVRERIGEQHRWKVLFWVERQGSWARTNGSGRRGRISLDLGWRRVGDELRVATWRNDEGESGEVRLPARYLEQLEQCERLQSIRDQPWNLMRAAFLAWLRVADLPDWLRVETAGWAQVRRKGRAVRLLRLWKERRYKGDEVGFNIVNTWYYGDAQHPGGERHLYEWQAHLRDQALRDRRERYRVFAAGLVRRYEEVVLEDFDLSRVAQVARAKELTAQARWQRFAAGCYQLRQAIESACRREGVRVVRVPAAYTTAICSVCGSLERWDHRELRHRCEACGSEWDQDYSAAANLLATAG